jgi:hypothetical protein
LIRRKKYMKREFKKTMVVVGIILLFLSAGATPCIAVVNGDTSSTQPSVNIQKVFDDITSKLEKVTTKQEALAVCKEAVRELHHYGLLPKGMSVQKADRLIDYVQLRSAFVHPSRGTRGITSGNVNCLVIGITNNTYFRPYPALMDIPMFQNITGFLLLPYLIRLIQPLKVGPYGAFGDRVKLTENGNITDDISPSSGFILTFGSNGFQKWKGAFFGNLKANYKKFVYNNETSAEFWDPIGVVGFIGINFLSVFTLNQNVPMFYIGFAREVNFTYSYPWT